MEDIKHQIIETLRYPRYLVRNELELENCPNNGEFNAANTDCEDCLDGQDCKWLFSSEEKFVFDDRPLEQLIAALGFAIESVESLMNSTEHDSLCHCDACLWRRKADNLYGEVRCHPELPLPPMPH